MNILVKRSIALGDVILTLPIVQWLWNNCSDGEKIDFYCSPKCADIFENSPYANVIHSINSSVKYDKIINLDLAYEKRPNMHIIEAYAEEAGINADELEQPKMFPAESVMYSADVIIHAARSWKNRTWSNQFWNKVAIDLNCRVAFVGSAHDYGFEYAGIDDLRGKLSLTEIHSVIKNSGCFIGSDSGIIHIASTTDTPIIGLYSTAKADYRKPWRKSAKFKALEPNIDCYGCLHRQVPPVTYCDCPTGRNYACLPMITPEMVIEAYRGIK